MLKTVLADVFHQLLQVVDLRHSDAAVHTVGIVGDLTLAEIGLDTPLGIIGRDAEEGKGTFRHFRIDSAEGINLAKRTSEDTEGTQFQVVVAHERLGIVAAVGADTLVAILSEVVVPVE